MCIHLVGSNVLHPVVNGWAEAQRPLLELDQGGRPFQDVEDMTWMTVNVGIAIINKPPLFDGSYHPFMVMNGGWFIIAPTLVN